MNIQKANIVFNSLEQDTLIQRFIAQANARYILFTVKEPIERFPTFTPELDSKLNFAAFTYFTVACTYFENKLFDLSVEPFQKGATILEYIHKPEINRKEKSKFFILAASIGYYAAHQYSKSFILLKDITFDTDILNLISCFLKKDFGRLNVIINRILLGGNHSDERITELAIQGEDVDHLVYSAILAKALSSFLEYIYTGSLEWIDLTRDTLKDLLEIVEADEDPAMWWVIRLLIIVINGFQSSSLWNVLPPLINYPNDSILTGFISNLLFRPIPIIELFPSQTQALPKALNRNTKGAVISLPTSSGKTRIAEIAILQILIENPNSKILYLAPFRSLAYEIEENLQNSLSPLGYTVSQLYGGNQYNRIDVVIIEESNVIIATPEKAKAIIRSNPEIIESIKVIIIDEGHLLGAEERFIINELFIEELRKYSESNNSRIILLSAVLPNFREIAKWITDDESNAVSSSWKSSSERLGVVEWNGKGVDIEWKDPINASFNKNFVEISYIKKGKKETPFPKDKKEAIAATAVKLSSVGPVLIFVGIKASVFTYAKAVRLAMGENANEFDWGNSNDWSFFSLACREAFGENSELYEHAKYGIVCHNGALPVEVRVFLERLMRKASPPIIISTSTLGQGVNLGITTVIFANVWVNRKTITHRDFWNIAGRAGRAFVDTEGKILFAVDKTVENYKINTQKELVNLYFKKEQIDDTRSGLLLLIIAIKRIAVECDIEFNVLIELIANNDFEKFQHTEKDFSKNLENFFDLIDDSLLAINNTLKSYQLEDSSSWVDDFFRSSLAVIQTKHELYQTTPDEVIEIIKARNQAVIKISGHHTRWKSLIAAGIPLKSSIILETLLDSILKEFHYYQDTEKTFDCLLKFLEEIESLLSYVPVISKKYNFDQNILREIRRHWLSGTPVSVIQSLADIAQEVCVDYFGYSLPWVLNAISKKLLCKNLQEEAKQFEELAVLVELGLPNLFSVKLYLAGIKSRSAATEVSNIMDISFQQVSIRKLSAVIISNAEELFEKCSDNTGSWVNILLKQQQNSSHAEIKRFPNFKLNIESEIKVLNTKRLNDKIFLCSPDFSVKIDVTLNEIPFELVANNTGINFIYDTRTASWKINLLDPKLQFKSELEDLFSIDDLFS